MSRDTGTAGATGVELRDLPWGSGVLTGLVSFVGSYLVFFATVALGGSVPNITGAWKTIGIFFYNAHFVPTKSEVVLDTGRTVQVGSGNTLIEQGTTAIPLPVYLGIPAVVLVAAGFAYASYHFDVGPGEDLAAIGKRSLGSGVAIALGYLLAALLGSFLFVITSDIGQGTQYFLVDRLQVLYIGFLYPLLGGVVGTGAGQLVGRSRSEGSETSRAPSQHRGAVQESDTGDSEAPADER